MRRGMITGSSYTWKAAQQLLSHKSVLHGQATVRVCHIGKGWETHSCDFIISYSCIGKHVNGHHDLT